MYGLEISIKHPIVNYSRRLLMNLTDREKEQLKAMIDRGEKLPPKFKSQLFENVPEVELVWAGKTSEVTNVVLPFQSIEQIDEPRKDAGKQSGQMSFMSMINPNSGRQQSGWSNKLIWGDNKLVLSSLKNGPMREEIEKAGGLKLVYIDPPFDVGADFSFDVEVGEDVVTKQPSIIEELAYRDTWGKGSDSYIAMLYERVAIIYDLLSPDGSIYVHCDWRVDSHVRLILDEVFGNNSHKNELIWHYEKWTAPSKSFQKNHDVIFLYSKSEKSIFNVEMEVTDNLKEKYKNGYLIGGGYGSSGLVVYDRDNPKVKSMIDSGKYIVHYADMKGKPLSDVWRIPFINPVANERLNYPTQKPEKLIERVINASSNEGDLVADFFCGSGTTLAVAEKLGRKWIGCDLGRFAIHTTRKRMIGVQRELKQSAKSYRSFEILNLGKYERQYFVGIDPTLPEAQRKAQTLQREEHYLTLILTAYKAERVFQLSPFHGKKGGTVVLVGPIDAPVTLTQVNELIDACRQNKLSKADILGFEFEMGLVPAIQDEARQKGVTLSLKYIPKDVFDRRAIERNQVKFYDVAFVEILPKVEGNTIRIQLKDFGVFYHQDDIDNLGASLKDGGSKVTIDCGQVVKISKNKKGVVSKDVLTKKWTDWIDYWAVDFDYASRKEIIRILENGQEREVWTGNYIFENEWQSFRTKSERRLELMSGKHDYPEKGKYKVAVKVIDIFGNDTTKVVEVKI